MWLIARITGDGYKNGGEVKKFEVSRALSFGIQHQLRRAKSKEQKPTGFPNPESDSLYHCDSLWIKRYHIQNSFQL
jgi:hypothetical protein